MCGLCCQLFLINLNETEYRSGSYKTEFQELDFFDDFLLAQNCGANIIQQSLDGSCIYLTHGRCIIHDKRPAVCREFFCQGDELKFKEMRKTINNVKYHI